MDDAELNKEKKQKKIDNDKYRVDQLLLYFNSDCTLGMYSFMDSRSLEDSLVISDLFSADTLSLDENKVLLPKECFMITIKGEQIEYPFINNRALYLPITTSFGAKYLKSMYANLKGTIQKIVSFSLAIYMFKNICSKDHNIVVNMLLTVCDGYAINCDKIITNKDGIRKLMTVEPAYSASLLLRPYVPFSISSYLFTTNLVDMTKSVEDVIIHKSLPINSFESDDFILSTPLVCVVVGETETGKTSAVESCLRMSEVGARTFFKTSDLSLVRRSLYILRDEPYNLSLEYNSKINRHQVEFELGKAPFPYSDKTIFKHSIIRLKDSDCSSFGGVDAYLNIRTGFNWSKLLSFKVFILVDYVRKVSTITNVNDIRIKTVFKLLQCSCTDQNVIDDVTSRLRMHIKNNNLNKLRYLLIAIILSYSNNAIILDSGTATFHGQDSDSKVAAEKEGLIRHVRDVLVDLQNVTSQPLNMNILKELFPFDVDKVVKEIKTLGFPYIILNTIFISTFNVSGSIEKTAELLNLISGSVDIGLHFNANKEAVVFSRYLNNNSKTSSNYMTSGLTLGTDNDS